MQCTWLHINIYMPQTSSCVCVAVHIVLLVVQGLFRSGLESAEGWPQGATEGVCGLFPGGHGGSAHRPQQAGCYTRRKHVGP